MEYQGISFELSSPWDRVYEQAEELIRLREELESLKQLVHELIAEINKK